MALAATQQLLSSCFKCSRKQMRGKTANFVHCSCPATMKYTPSQHTTKAYAWKNRKQRLFFYTVAKIRQKRRRMTINGLVLRQTVPCYVQSSMVTAAHLQSCVSRLRLVLLGDVTGPEMFPWGDVLGLQGDVSYRMHYQRRYVYVINDTGSWCCSQKASCKLQLRPGFTFNHDERLQHSSSSRVNPPRKPSCQGRNCTRSGDHHVGG